VLHSDNHASKNSSTTGVNMESLFVSLTVAAVSALGFLAYKHPKAYNVLALCLMVVLTLLFAGTGIWNIAIGRAYLALYDAIPSTNQENARHIVAAAKTPSTWTYVIVGFIFYIQLLRGLPSLLEFYKEEKPTGSETS
jgi:hypothetical protein